MKNESYIFEFEFDVRDYELDLQGVVNNANYMHYLEHARHKYLETREIDFSRLHDEGMDLIVIKAELNYRTPLRSRDRFVVKLNIYREGHLRIVFRQDIFRLSDNRLILDALITGTCICKGRPCMPDHIISALIP